MKANAKNVKEKKMNKIKASEGNVLVSVYGTLKQGWGNHRLLQRDPVVTGNIGIAKLDGVGFPIIKLGDNYRLKVEVYEVNPDDLKRLDGLEGYTPGRTPTFYDRKTINVTLADGSELETYVYEYVSDFDNKIESECTKSSGVYNWTGGYK